MSLSPDVLVLLAFGLALQAWLWAPFRWGRR